MNLSDALKTLQAAPEDAEPYRVMLACGFTPLHVRTFLAAHLQRALPRRKVAVSVGLFNDLAGTLEACRQDPQVQGTAVALEWQDLDPRLGYRGAGRWGLAAIDEILESARSALDRIGVAISELAARAPVAIAPPGLAMPPLFSPPGWQASQPELLLNLYLAEFLSRMAQTRGCSIVNLGGLSKGLPSAGRLDLKSDLLIGAPYTLAYADSLAEAMARLLAAPAPKKGLITDLDDTLWSGLVGEIGPENVGWDLAGGCQLHGLYQNLLGALSQEGVLIAIASKNSPEVARKALERADLVVPSDRIFPIEIGWEPKSALVTRILKVWNVAADSVVFVDDSPMEIAEVAAVHPGIEGVLFRKNDYAAAGAMLRQLRDSFGKPAVSGDDMLRLSSIRQGAAYESASRGASMSEAFLAQLDAEMTFDLTAAGDPRALELVNKTNQFNLNGLRYTDSDWRNRWREPGSVLIAVQYSDRFGPLGKIAALGGRIAGAVFYLDLWVMSCRAFSRRIEHQTLRFLFQKFGVGRIVLDFRETPRNGPLQDFLAAVAGADTYTLAMPDFEKACPPLYHRVVELQPSINA